MFSSAALTFEVFDFAPIMGHIDSHALWHAGIFFQQKNPNKNSYFSDHSGAFTLLPISATRLSIDS